MTVALDHIVHFTPSVADSIHAFNQAGRHSRLGGNHHMWGTHNGLYYAGVSYIEFLGIKDMNTAMNSTNQLIRLLCHDTRSRWGLGTIALRTEDINSLRDTFIQRGIHVSDIIDAERMVESGTYIRWKMLFIDEQPSGSLPWPFFIQWEETDEQRSMRLSSQGIVTSSNEGIHISSVIFEVKNVKETILKWGNTFGMPASAFSSLDGRTPAAALHLNDVILIFQENAQALWERPAAVTFKDEQTDGCTELYVQGAKYYWEGT